MEIPDIPEELTRTARNFYVTDTVGGAVRDPYQSPDYNARMTHLIKNGRSGDEFVDVKENPSVLAPYHAANIFDLHREGVNKFRSLDLPAGEFGADGVLLNCAARKEPGKNGSDFYLAITEDGGIRVVATPVSVLSTVRDEIEFLYRLLPHNVEIFLGHSQFRSGDVSILLDRRVIYRALERGYLERTELQKIPQDGLRQNQLVFADAFGNLNTTIPHGCVKKGGRYAVTIGEKRLLAICDDLVQGPPDHLLIYPNGKRWTDISYKWPDGYPKSSKDLERDSAFDRLGRPKIGAEIHIEDLCAEVSIATAQAIHEGVSSLAVA